MPHFNCASCFLHSWPLADWQRYITLLRNVTFHSGSIQLRATRNVSRTCPARRSFFFFFFNLLQDRYRVNIGLLMASGFCSPWPLLALFSPLLRFSPAVQLTLWVSWQDKCFVNSRPTLEFHATTFQKTPLAMRRSATWRYINYTHGHLERVVTGWRSSECTYPHKDGCYLKPGSYLAH